MLATLLVALATGLATGLGVVPFFFRETLPRRLFDAILGMGAGLMLSAATLGLLSAAVERVRPAGVLDAGVLIQVLLGFAAGVAVLVLMERIPHQHAGGHQEHITHAVDPHEVHPHEHQHGAVVKKGILITGAMTIHRIPEGFAIGAGFASGELHALGWVLAVAIAFQNVCEGAVMAAPLRHGGWSKLRTLAAVSATGLVIPAMAMVGYATGATLTGFLPFALALASGALIYLVSNEVIPETHSHGNEKLASLGLVGGFAITIIVASLGHSH